jgi:hypothetical protein
MDRNYRIFDFVLKSNIPLPELTSSPSTSAEFSFTFTSIPPVQKEKPRWLHHWLLPNGEKTYSFGKTGSDLLISFPGLADFLFSPRKVEVTCTTQSTTPLPTIRHLLLDQVIPRIVNSLGRPVIHASGVVIDKAAILFLGETGWGKSTLSAFFHQGGFPLLSDDSILLEKNGNNVTGIPGYPGMRLLEDSLEALHLEDKSKQILDNVSSNSAKKRICLCHTADDWSIPIPIKAFFVLNDPETLTGTHPLHISRITGTAAVMELLKHCFHLDPTDILLMGQHLKAVTEFLAVNKIPIFNLTFPRNLQLLSSICQEIRKFVTLLP